MPVGKKILWIIIILGATIATYVILFAMMPFFRETANVAATAPSASNFSAYQAAMTSAPWWMLAIPGGCGLIASVLVMRQKEYET